MGGGPGQEPALATKGRITPVGGVSLKQIRAFWITLLKLYARSSPKRSRGASDAVSPQFWLWPTY